MKPLRELAQDPNYDYMVGRLVSATEMLSHYIAIHGDEKARAMADQAHKTIDYFLTDDEKHDPPSVSARAHEEDTLIIPPQP
jgi:hypothetical protein